MTVLCTGFGEPVGDDDDRLWNRTPGGWIADHHLLTGTTAAVAPGCTGAALERPLRRAPRAPTGHRARRAPGGPARARLAAGTLVEVQCVRRGGPAVGTAGRSDEWLRLSDGLWVPRVVLSGAAAPGAQPPC